MKKNIVFTTIVFFVIHNLIFSQVVNLGQVIVKDYSILSCGEYQLLNRDTSIIVNDGNVHLKNHFLNDGELTYINDNGVFHFKGENNQDIITGLSGITEFQNVYFDNFNEAIYNVVNSFTIHNKAYFNSGIVNNTAINSEIIFTKLAEANNASNASYINGKVIKEGSPFFSFPVGGKTTAIYRPFLIKPNYDIDIIQNEYFLEDSNQEYPHINKDDDVVYINSKEYWEIVNPNDDENMEAGIVLNDLFLSDEVSNYLYNTELAIIHYDLEKSKWVNKGGIINNNIIYNNSLKLKTGPYTIGRVKSVIEDDLIIYNAISPNANSQNDYLIIKGIENYPNNTLEVFNRYGHQVFNTKHYGINDNLWYGTYNGEKLPTGTYFYIFKFIIENGAQVEKTGYLYIN